MEGRYELELVKRCADEKFIQEKTAAVTKLEDLLGRVKKADPEWMNAFYERLRNETLNALENFGRAAALVDCMDTALKNYDERHKEPPKLQNQLAFGEPVAGWGDWGEIGKG